jgi:general secretion pathway protein G
LIHLQMFRQVKLIVSKGVHRAEDAFTLVELISVIAIIAILAAIAIPAYSSYILKAQIVRTIAEIRMLDKEITIYGADLVSSADVQADAEPSEAANPPDSSKPVKPPDPPDPPSDPTDLRLPDSLAVIGHGSLLDPWGHPYQYLKIAGGDVKGKGKLRRDRFLNPLNADYDLYSMGPDGDTKTNLNAKESRDDIVRANSGAFIGTASDFDPG